MPLYTMSWGQAAWVLACWILGFFIGRGSKQRPRVTKVVKLADVHPNKRCPACNGMGVLVDRAPVADFNCAECGARAGGRHSGVCSRGKAQGHHDACLVCGLAGKPPAFVVDTPNTGRIWLCGACLEIGRSLASEKA